MASQTTLLTPQELTESLKTPKPPLLVDVRSEESFALGHIPSAKHNSVYRVVFMENIDALHADRNAPICVYGNCDQTYESRVAAEKLVRAGFTEVQEFRAGFDAWKAAGLPIEVGNPPPPVPREVADGNYEINLQESRLQWIGRNLLNQHSGWLPIKSGFLRFSRGKLTGGEFVFDMNGITCQDLKGNSMCEVLLNHLRSDDFFDTKVYPEARYVITGSSILGDGAPGAPNLSIRGNLTIKNVTLPLELQATAGFTEEGKMAAQAVLSFDRTLWNVIYGSARFFRDLGQNLVNNLIEVQIRIETK